SVEQPVAGQAVGWARRADAFCLYRGVSARSNATHFPTPPCYYTLVHIARPFPPSNAVPFSREPCNAVNTCGVTWQPASVEVSVRPVFRCVRQVTSGLYPALAFPQWHAG